MTEPVGIALDEPLASEVREELRRDGVRSVAGVPREVLDAAASGRARDTTLAGLAVLVVPATAAAVTAHTVALADRLGIRLVLVGEGQRAARIAASFGLFPPIPPARARDIVRAVIEAPARVAVPPRAAGPRTIAVWGPPGAPGRTTMAVTLATELARGGRHVALVDADTHAPAVAISLGLADEGPGFAAACRQAELGVLDAAELTRISLPLESDGGSVDVLVGINRPSRWPELTASRVADALGACREWADHTVVDVAASLEHDEEIVSDLVGGLRRNAATLAALAAADHIVAVLAADPVSTARFLRGYTELRAVVGATPISVVVNRFRGPALGIDARGQLRRTLERYAGIREVWFVPDDRRGMDAAILAARPVAAAAPRSVLVAAVRRMVGEGLVRGVAGPVPAPSARREHRTRRRGVAARRAPAN